MTEAHEEHEIGLLRRFQRPILLGLVIFALLTFSITGAALMMFDPDPTEVAIVLPDGSSAFFLGIIDDTNPFGSASLTADGGPGGPFFLYNVDDITTAPAAANVVPEPASLLLLGMGTAGLMAAGAPRRRRATAR